MNPINDHKNFSSYWKNHWLAVIQYLGFALILFGIKLWLIGTYGNATPFWDQWDGEAARLYKPFLEDTLSWTNLFSLHNEHRIFTTRILALGLLLANGIWNPVLQMVVNATIHIAAIIFLINRITRVVGHQYLSVLLLFSLILFSVPYAWENTLAGFQSQFYFLIFFGTASLWLTITYPPLSLGWWGGIACSVLAFFSLASGIFALAASSAVGVIIYALGVRRTNKQLISIAMMLGLFVIGYLLTPSLAYHAPLKAHSISQFLKALFYSLSWPAHEKLFFLGILIYLPALIFAWNLLLNRPKSDDKHWFILALLIWCLGQAVSVSYGRAVFLTASRYLDLLAIGLLVNFSALLILLTNTNPQRQSLYRVAMAAWLAIIATGFSTSVGEIANALHAKAIQGEEQEKSVRTYLCSGDISNLQNKPLLSVPYPDVDRLKSLLDDPTIRRILPSNIYRQNPQQPVGPDGEPFCDPGSLLRPFSLKKWNGTGETISSVAGTEAIKSNGWSGTDYWKSSISGYQVIGSFINSENDTGIITIKLHRGDRVLYRSGPRVSGQFILIDNGGVGKFFTNLPVALEWSVLEFSQESLPDEFDVSFIDGGTKWGEWSAIALRIE